jgi:hypothetical protein
MNPMAPNTIIEMPEYSAMFDDQKPNFVFDSFRRSPRGAEGLLAAALPLEAAAAPLTGGGPRGADFCSLACDCGGGDCRMPMAMLPSPIGGGPRGDMPLSGERCSGGEEALIAGGRPTFAVGDSASSAVGST